MIIYIISQADYEGRYMPIKAFMNQQDAEEFVERKNNYHKRMQEKNDELEVHYYNCHLGDNDGNGCDMCKEYIELDFDGLMTHYSMRELECE